GQIDTPHAAEERTEETLFQKVDGGRPVLLAGHGELVEVSARQPAWKDELIGERGRPGVDGSARAACECRAVKVAVGGLGRIDARTLRTDQTHRRDPCRMRDFWQPARSASEDGSYTSLALRAGEKPGPLTPSRACARCRSGPCCPHRAGVAGRGRHVRG